MIKIDWIDWIMGCFSSFIIASEMEVKVNWRQKNSVLCSGVEMASLMYLQEIDIDVVKVVITW